ncbi:hypothetical protein [Palleronia sp.]|uniref:hypothetical protein n=1 Tax=Palleronia sp. TaxID=1940284 RepID=UPI0035C8730C
MFPMRAQAILLTSAGALFALFATGLGAMLLIAGGLLDPGHVAAFGMPMQVALVAFGAAFAAAALILALRGGRRAR